MMTTDTTHKLNEQRVTRILRCGEMSVDRLAAFADAVPDDVLALLPRLYATGRVEIHKCVPVGPWRPGDEIAAVELAGAHGAVRRPVRMRAMAALAREYTPFSAPWEAITDTIWDESGDDTLAQLAALAEAWTFPEAWTPGEVIREACTSMTNMHARQ